MIELVASDMDGTLLNSQLLISKENRQAIELLEQHSIPFVICTGRNYDQARVCLDPYEITCPIIAVNGSQTYDADGQLIESITISFEDVAACLKVATQNQLHWEAVTSEGLYTNDLAERFELLANMQKRMNPTITDEELKRLAKKYHTLVHATEMPDYRMMLANPSLHIYKISCFHTDGPPAFVELRHHVNMHLPNLVVTSSNFDNIEINHIDAQKGLALKRYTDRYGFDMKHVLAIGDNGNDLSMLTLAGYSYAMANAEDDIKKIATYSTVSNDESGVAKAINEQLLANGVIL